MKTKNLRNTEQGRIKNGLWTDGQTDGPKDGWTGGRTDGQALILRCEDASKKSILAISGSNTTILYLPICQYNEKGHSLTPASTVEIRCRSVALTRSTMLFPDSLPSSLKREIFDVLESGGSEP